MSDPNPFAPDCPRCRELAADLERVRAELAELKAATDAQERRTIDLATEAARAVQWFRQRKMVIPGG